VDGNARREDWLGSRSPRVLVGARSTIFHGVNVADGLSDKLLLMPLEDTPT
jgi:hypothetical protein